jgi:hypothetical protein
VELSKAPANQSSNGPAKNAAPRALPPRQQLEDVDVHYGATTRPQERLPFSSYVRRRFRWWPGSERHGKLIDRLLLVLALSPFVIWASFSFGWASVLCGFIEAVVILELVYRFSTGSLLGD